MSDTSTEERRERFAAVYDAHYHRVLGYAQRRAGRDDALDIVAETFLVAWRRLDKVPDGEQALPWLYATARRVLANHRRAERRRADLLSAIESEPGLAPSPHTEGELQRIAAALALLREPERELLLLLAWEGLDAAGAAAVLGCSRNAVRIRIHRARRRFANALSVVDRDVPGSERRRHAFVPRAAERLELEDSP